MKKILIIILLFLTNFVTYSQSKPIIDNIPQEKIFAHLNTTFLVSGEALYYKVYCQNIKTNKPSVLSKIAYVELVSSEKKSIFKHKIKLIDGQGYGDFFIPAPLKSGTYKLIAYTKLMRNKNLFFENDLFLINPFHEDQSKVIDTISTSNSDISNNTQNNILKIDNKYLSLKLASDKLKTREKVSLQLTSLLDEVSYGKYSISVKKIVPIIKIPNKKTSITYNNNFNVDTQELVKTSNFYIPEFRGELLIGKVIEQKTNNAIPNKKVAISIPGKNPIFKISSTNADGTFYFNLNESYENSSALFQVIGDLNNLYEIIIPKEKPIDYNQFKFNNYFITEKSKNFILTNSINNQIENSFGSVKKDSIFKFEKVNPFYGSIATVYNLDDFKRFPTLKETFVEVIENAWIVSKKGNYYFKIKRHLKSIDYDLPTLLLVDGILIQNHADIIDYDAYKIDKINVVRDQYIYGPHIFEGLISIHTKNGNYPNALKNSYVKEIKLFKPEIQKKYFSPNYTDNNNYDRIPDFRSQLFWLPNLILDKKEISISFYTSDNIGEYEINIEGFTNNGKPVSIVKNFKVK